MLADDLAQEVLLAAWKQLPTLKDPVAFATWLRQIAIRQWLMHIRRVGREMACDAALPCATASAMHTPAMRTDLDEALGLLAPLGRALRS